MSKQTETTKNANITRNWEGPTRTFTMIKDGVGFKTTVLSSFFEQKLPTQDNLDYLDIIKNYDLLKYLHNPLGPAIKNKDGYESFWLKARPAKKEEIERLKYNHDFSTHMDNIINSED